MRPRHKAAEYGAILDRLEAVIAASMRPRHKAAEYRNRRGDRGLVELASMRPRHKAAEYQPDGHLWVPVFVPSFNEAAA